MKKLIAGTFAAALSISSAVGASAYTWNIRGYDTSVLEKEAYNTYRVGIVYEQVDNNGLATGVVADSKTAPLYGLKPYAEATFTKPLFERAWPNREYVSVLADGVNTGKVLYTGVKENLEYRDANFMWDLAKPHMITSRKQAKIYGSWYTDETYPTQYAGDVATVSSEYSNYYGVGYWKVVGSKAYYMPEVLRPYAPNLDTDVYFKDIYNNEEVAVDALAPGSVLNLTGKKDVEIKKAFSLVVAGPKFNFDGSVTPGNEYADVHSAADVKDNLANFGVAELVKNVYYYDGTCALADVEWVGGEDWFEMAQPYRYYEYLKVGGVLMDGSWTTVEGTDIAVQLPKIYRYIVAPNGTYATANVNATYTSTLSSPAARWNADVNKFEFLVDITEVLSKDGKPFATHVVTQQPSNVFGQLNYTENWVDGQKVITGVLEGKALTTGEVYRAKVYGPVNDVIDWGRVSFDAVDATVDYNYGTIDGITVPATID